MQLPICLIATDFDGTLHSELEAPPVPEELQALLGALQAGGVSWVINTGRDLASLQQGLGLAQLSVQPDFLVTVEREIYGRRAEGYVGFGDWNNRCAAAHEELFIQVRRALPALTQSVQSQSGATIFEDDYSPFCVIAQNRGEADAIHQIMLEFARGIPKLTAVRNDLYFRFSHCDFNKGTALGAIAHGLGLLPEQVFAAGDDLNDLPMLNRDFAHWLAAPDNAIDEVKSAVRAQEGYVSQQPYGYGVARSLEYFLERTDELGTVLNRLQRQNKAS